MEVGYSSEYIFRGTNLTPNSDGIEWQQIYFSGNGFTLGAWFATQIGSAVVSGATSVGESGSGVSPYNRPGISLDVANQSRFKELDIFSSYTHSFGPIDITFGNIVFLIHRSEVDEFNRFHPHRVFPYGVPEDEQFDRLFLAASTNKIHPFGIPIIPTVTYYQTILNEVNSIRTPGGPPPFHGCGPSNGGCGTAPPGDARPVSDERYEFFALGFLRNDTLGGYLEAKIQSVIPIVGNVLRLEPTAVISYSAGDRSEGVPSASLDPVTGLTSKSSSKPLYGFNHFQAGAELVWQITKQLSVTGFGNYAYHIANPTAGTDRNEWWGGGKVTVSF